MSRKNNNIRRRARFDGGDNTSYIRSQTISSYDPSDDEAISQDISQRLSEQRRSPRKRRLAVVLIILAALAGLAVLVITQFAASVSSVEYTQGSVSAKKDDQYLALANQYLASHPSERFLWLLHDDELLAEAKAAFPEIAKATISSGLAGGTRLKLSLRSPVAVWLSGNKRSYVDQDGVAFETNYFDEPNITITDLNSSSSANGISGRMLEFIGKTIAGIEESGVGKVKEVSIPVSAARYVEMKLVGREFFIKVQIDRDVESQITDIENTVKFLDGKGIKPNYIDVRIKNRAFWK
jgi:hypothetical protein